MAVGFRRISHCDNINKTEYWISVSQKVLVSGRNCAVTSTDYHFNEYQTVFLCIRRTAMSADSKVLNKYCYRNSQSEPIGIGPRWLLRIGGRGCWRVSKILKSGCMGTKQDSGALPSLLPLPGYTDIRACVAKINVLHNYILGD